MAYSINASDTKAMTQARIAEQYSELYPEVDFSQDTSQEDLVMAPVTIAAESAHSDLKNIRLQKNMDNAELMTEAELDALIQGNYFMTRRAGQKASTRLTLTFIDLMSKNSNADLIIPPGIKFANSRGYQFQTINRTVIPKNQFYKYYNQRTSRYEIDVYVEALMEGESFNSDYQTINTIQTYFDSRLVSATNNYAVTNGLSRETNVDVANRVRRWYYTRNVGTKPGMEEIVRETAPTVRDVKVEGYGDPNMMRDIILFGNAKILPIHEKDYEAKTITLDGEYPLPAPTPTEDGPKSFITLLGVTEEVYEVDDSNYIVADGKTTIYFSGSHLTPNRYWNSLIYAPDSISHYQHNGGKVDIYISGTSKEQTETVVPYLSGTLVFPMGFEYLSKEQLTITATLNGEAEPISADDFDMETVTQNYFYVPMYVGYVAIRLKDSVILDLINRSKTGMMDFAIKYTETPSEPTSPTKTQFYRTGRQTYSLSAPLAEDDLWSNILALLPENCDEMFVYEPDEENDDGATKDSDIFMSRTGVTGTTKEYDTMTLLPTLKKKIPNIGSADGYNQSEGANQFTIRYMVDASISAISSVVMSEAKRSLCADTLCMSAPEIPVEVRLKVRLTEAAKADAENVREQIKASINEFFRDYTLGRGITEEDFIGYLYKDENVYPHIAFVQKPMNQEDGSASFNLIEHIDNDGTIYYRPREETDGLDNNTPKLPIYEVEQPVLDEDRFQVTFF